MPVNKVEFANETLIDISDSTVTAETLETGKKAYSADGSVVEGALDVQARIEAVLEEIANGSY